MPRNRVDSIEIDPDGIDFEQLHLGGGLGGHPEADEASAETAADEK